jgi:adenylate cyclase
MIWEIRGRGLEGEQRRLVAILVADVVGYSKLIGDDEGGTLAQLKALLSEVIKPAIGKHSGRLFKSVGDGFLVEFASAVQAVNCAKAIQEANTGSLSLRIGIHVGDVVVQGDDLMGDGVNIAARVEGAAEAGGIAISRQVHDQVRGKVSLAFVDKGEIALKNIEQPVRVFAIAGSATTAATPALALPDKPSIAVLPFQNMSGDPEQEYFVDGLVEDIITALSRFKSLFVIARNSSFAYKGKSPDMRQVGRELGVRYVLEGSVRKAGNRLRITAQLIDATSGAHTWADRFEGVLEDVFAFQDEVTVKVVAAIAPRVERAEIERARRRPPANTDAYDCYLRGLSCLSSMSADGVMKAMRLFEQASALDPNYSVAYAMTLTCHVFRVAYVLVEDIEHERSEATRLWRIVMRIGQDDGEVLSRVAWAAALVLRDLASAKRLIDQAVELNPNLATAWANSGWINVWLGHPEIALEHLGRAQRLDPGENPPPRWTARAHALFFLDRYEEAVVVVEQGLQHSPDHIPGLRIGAANAALAGRSDVAHRLAAHMRSLDPAFLISRFRGQIGPYQKIEFAEKYTQALRLAGLPE